MAQQVIDETVTTKADPASVYGLLADGSTWPAWSPIGSFELVEPGEGTPEGLGAVRLSPRAGTRAGSGSWRASPGRSSPTNSRRACPCGTTGRSITLRPCEGGTTINWRSTFRAKVPGTGWLYRRELGKFIRRPWRGWPRRPTGPTASVSPLASRRWSWRWRRPRRRSSRPLRGCTKARRSWDSDSSRAGSASPRRPWSPSSRAPRPSMASRAWKSMGGRLGEVDGGQLEEPVAVVGHHDLGRRVGQLGPHGVDLGLGRRLLVAEAAVRRRPVTSVSPGRPAGGEAPPPPSSSGEMLARRCPEAAHAGTVCCLDYMEAGPPLRGLHLATTRASSGAHVRQVDRLSGAGSARWSASLHRLARGRTAGPSERCDDASSLKPQLSTGSMTESVPVKSGSSTPTVCN